MSSPPAARPASGAAGERRGRRGGRRSTATCYDGRTGPAFYLPVPGQRAKAFATPPFSHNFLSNALCYAQCYDILAYLRARNPLFVTLFKTWCLVATLPGPELAAVFAENYEDALSAFVAQNYYHPFVIGKAVALEAHAFH